MHSPPFFPMDYSRQPAIFQPIVTPHIQVVHFKVKKNIWCQGHQNYFLTATVEAPTSTPEALPNFFIELTCRQGISSSSAKSTTGSVICLSASSATKTSLTSPFFMAFNVCFVPMMSRDLSFVTLL